MTARRLALAAPGAVLSALALATAAAATPERWGAGIDQAAAGWDHDADLEVVAEDCPVLPPR